MTFYVCVALFVLLCFLLRDRLGERMTQAITDVVGNVLLLLAILLLYYLFCEK